MFIDLTTGRARRLIVTRPAAEAERWRAQLAARGFDAVMLPLIDIAPPLDRQALDSARASLARHDAVFFVSGTAVSRFFEEKMPFPHVHTLFSATNMRAWAPGPATACALRAAGVPEDRIDAPAADAAQFDSEALWAVVRGQIAPGGRALIVRGSGADGRPAGRDWLARELAAAGVKVDEVAAYQRRAPVWTDAERALACSALSAPAAVWLFSSSEAIANLLALLSAENFEHAAAIATHPRIASAARAAGFGVVFESRPTLGAVVASIESFH